jgi:chromate transporter
MIYLRLFFEFLKIGLFAVGGGMATLPFLYDLADRTGWFTASQIADMLAVSESTPGPIGINMATYVGYIVGGHLGSAVATIGVIIPGTVLVIIVCKVLDKFRGNKLVTGAFYGIRPSSTALITAAGLMVAKITFLDVDAYKASGAVSSLFDWRTLLFAAILLVLTRIRPTKKLHPVVFIAISALVGIAFKF